MQDNKLSQRNAALLRGAQANLDDVGTPGSSHERDLLVLSGLGRAIEVLVCNRLAVECPSSDSRHRENIADRPSHNIALLNRLCDECGRNAAALSEGSVAVVVQ